MTDFRTWLAEQTRAAHAAIERELALEGDVSLDRYIAYLRAMHAVIAHVEPAFEADARLRAFDLPARRKRHRLERDLRHFGADPIASPRVLPDGLAARVGWAYVLEGATLGGRVLYRRLAPRWSLTPERGGAFLAGHGDRTGEMWRAFVEALNRTAFTAEEKKACVAGAAQAFSAIAERFRASVAGANPGVDRQRRRGLAA